MGCGDKKLSKQLTQTFMAHCNAMICQQVTLLGDAEWPKVADAVIEAASGSGKTHLLRNILIQMIARDDGVGFCDPHGDLAEELLNHISPNRIKDVCYFNPADLRFPVAWNPLASVPKERQDRVVEGIVAAFSNLFGKGWGYQTEHILRNTIAILIAAENTSLLGIRKVLIDEDYRRSLLKQVPDPVVQSFWHDEFEAWEKKFRLQAIEIEIRL